jgi:Flp pilus assembly protein TadB
VERVEVARRLRALPREERPRQYRRNLDSFYWSIACWQYGRPVLSAAVWAAVFAMGAAVLIGAAGMTGALAVAVAGWTVVTFLVTWYLPLRLLTRFAREESSRPTP